MVKISETINIFKNKKKLKKKNFFFLFSAKNTFIMIIMIRNLIAGKFNFHLLENSVVWINAQTVNLGAHQIFGFISERKGKELFGFFFFFVLLGFCASLPKRRQTNRKTKNNISVLDFSLWRFYGKITLKLSLFSLIFNDRNRPRHSTIFCKSFSQIQKKSTKKREERSFISLHLVWLIVLSVHLCLRWWYATHKKTKCELQSYQHFIIIYLCLVI